LGFYLKLIWFLLKGPSWSPTKKIKKINLDKIEIKKESEKEEKDLNIESTKQATQDSVRAIMLIRAFRIRGHLIASLDPLGLLKKEVEDYARKEAKSKKKKAKEERKEARKPNSFFCHP
jgi:2-oxoglutarate dehydrogenase E1 component